MELLDDSEVSYFSIALGGHLSSRPRSPSLTAAA